MNETVDSQKLRNKTPEKAFVPFYKARMSDKEAIFLAILGIILTFAIGGFLIFIAGSFI